MTEFKTNCVTCGKPIVGKRSTKRYCNNACKQANKHKRYGKIRPETELSIMLDALNNLNKCDDRELLRYGTGIGQALDALDKLRERFEAIEIAAIHDGGWSCEVCGHFVTSANKPTECKICKASGFKSVKAMI